MARVYKILTSSYYADGEYLWGVTNSRTGEKNDPANVARIPLPPLISRDTYDRTPAKLAGHNPRIAPPRVVNGSSLLVGLAKCAICEAGMTRTGTTRRQRRYSYYSCAGHHAKGATACTGRHVPIEKLDTLVLTALKDRLFAPERLRLLLRSLVDQQALRSSEVAGRFVALQTAADETKARLLRLYKMVEDGIAEEDDILKQRTTVLRAEQTSAQAALTLAKLEATPAIVIDAERIPRFGLLMRERMDTGDVGAKRASIASVVSSIKVHDDRVRVVGQKDTLRRAVAGDPEPGENVLGFVRKWRAP